MMHLVHLIHRVKTPACCCVSMRSAKSSGLPFHKTRHISSFPNLTLHVFQLSHTFRWPSSQKTPAPQRFHNGQGRPRRRPWWNAPFSSSTAAVFPLCTDYPLVRFSPTSALRCENDDSIPTVTVLPEVITTADERALLAELDPVFGRKRYERGHWDAVIEDYKESERLDGNWSPRCRQIVRDIRALLLQSQDGSANEHKGKFAHLE